MIIKNIYKPPATYFVLILIALITVHAFLMNGHYHVYRHLTVGTYLDPLVAKADPSLFKNSIYVQTVNRTNVRLSPFYSVCSFIFKYFDFETFAIIQEIVSLFFVIMGIFTLTRVLFNSAAAGYIATLLYTMELNNWTLGSPAPYINFFHHGIAYAYPLMVWSMIFFFRRRYVPALFLAGLSWNFHPMLTVFLLFAYFLYWVFNRDKFPAATIGYCLLAFIVPALPVLFKSITYLGNTAQLDYNTWMTNALDGLVHLFSLYLALSMDCSSGSVFYPLYYFLVYCFKWCHKKRRAHFRLCSSNAVPYWNRVC